MENISVSIVVPVCNVENYLKECMDSILNQSLQNIEIICVDDGSTDHSLSILRSYEKKDKRVKVITKANSGYGNTMNVGMEQAKGKYIGIVESDDYIDSKMFERLYDTAESYEADIVKSDHYIFSTKNGKNKSQYQWVCPIEYYNRVLNAEICPEIYTFTMMNWTGIYRTDFVKNNQIKHNETPGASFQDNGFWYQVISLAKKIVFMLDEFYLALGQENRYSKFFHLFSIIEFIEKRYEDNNGASKLFDSEEIEVIVKAALDSPVLVDKEKRDRVRGALKQILGNLTDIGRKEKLVHILHEMGIYKIENCGTEFEIDSKTIGQIINLRNKCYHADRKNKEETKIDIDLAVTQLMYICERVIAAQVKPIHQ